MHWSGGGDPKVLLLGHHDTVFPIGTLATRPFVVADGRATGPGVFDMLAGIVQAIHGLAALDDRSGVELLFSADEEIGSGDVAGADRGPCPGLRGGAGARALGRRRSAQDRTQGMRHLRRRRARSCGPRRPRTGERRERPRRGGPPGARDQRPRASRRRHDRHADGGQRRDGRQRRARGGSDQGRRSSGVRRRDRIESRRRWQRCARSIRRRSSRSSGAINRPPMPESASAALMPLAEAVAPGLDGVRRRWGQRRQLHRGDRHPDARRPRRGRRRSARRSRVRPGRHDARAGPPRRRPRRRPCLAAKRRDELSERQGSVRSSAGVTSPGPSEPTFRYTSSLLRVSVMSRLRIVS